MFQGIACIKGKSIKMICITNSCKQTPFLCSQICDCSSLHTGECKLKDLQELNQDLKTILKFQFFIVYSPILRGSSINVAGRYAVQTQSPNKNTRYALTYDPIPRFTNEAVSFKLTKIKGCVGVGVFVREVLIKNEFRYIPDQQYIGHGGYMLLSNDLLYSHTRVNQNGKALSKFKVNEGDVIKVSYNFGKITFSCNFFEECLVLDLREGTHLHFGVYLYDVEDQVQILNNFTSK